LGQLNGTVRTIAIIEDDPKARLLLRRILQTRGEYRISEAEDGAAGIELIRREHPDLILLDLMMPGVDGFGVLDTIKSDEELGDIPVIVISAKELTAAEKERLSGQVEGLMQKGDFTDAELLEQILRQSDQK
jgi:threonine synthase